MIEEYIEEIGVESPMVRVHKRYIPDVMDLSDWIGDRDHFSLFDEWVNAVAQRYHDQWINTTKTWDKLTDEERMTEFKAVSDELVKLRNSHRPDPNDITEEPWIDDYRVIAVHLFDNSINFE